VPLEDIRTGDVDVDGLVLDECECCCEAAREDNVLPNVGASGKINSAGDNAPL
tara:strand:- start:575 stop:733 length:159 start_codon:yes stop_codon:yes gene_type:complete